MTPEEWQRKMQAALHLKGDAFQIPFAQIMQLFEIEQQNESNTLLLSTNYHAIFMERYREDFADPENVGNILKGMKKVLAAIAFMRDVADNVHHFQPEYETAQIELFDLKQADNLQKQAAREENLLKSALDASLFEEQGEELRAATEADRRKAQERDEAEAIALEKRVQKGTQEEALGVVETELGQHLEVLNTRLESFAGIRADLTRNWQQTEQRSTGLYALDAKTIFGFVSARVQDVDLGGINLAKVPERDALEGLQERYPLADVALFERISATEKSIQARITEINTLIDYTGLTMLKNAFPKDTEEAQKAEHGQLVLDLIAAVRQ